MKTCIRKERAGHAAGTEETRNVYKILVTRYDGETVAYVGNYTKIIIT
jgi:hypothetical protein